MSASDSFGKLILRLSVGGLLLFHGVAKLLDPASLNWITSEVTRLGLPPEVAYGVYAGEILGPVLIIIGLLTRIGALMIVVHMLAAFFLVHMDELMSINQFGGWQPELQGLFLFGALAIMFMGSGRYAALPDRF